MKKLSRPHTAAFLLLACLCSALHAAAPTRPESGETITLPKFEVKGNAICCYGFGVIATWDAKTQTVTHLYVDEVSPDSEADRIGLQRGDEILSINGRKIADMKGGLKRGSDLFALLVDQPVGRMTDFEVTVRVVKKVVLSATP